METFIPTALQWTSDLSVGCDRLDQRNHALLDDLAASEHMIMIANSDELVVWLQARLDQFAQLLDHEEAELAAADYPEQIFHRLLHDEGRRLADDIAAQLRRCDSKVVLARLVRTGCTSLSLWFVRHVLDADPFFAPYVDARFRGP